MVILDNLGEMLAKIFRNPTTGANFTPVDSMKRLNGAGLHTSMYNTNSNSTIFNDNAIVRQARVGNSNTPVTRQDFEVSGGFPDSPESSRNNSVDGGYNSGLGKIEQSTLISNTGGSGTVLEACKYIQVRDGFGGALNVVIAITRDLVSPVGFINGESINVTHEVLI